MVEILKLKFGQDFEAEFWSRFLRRVLVKILRLKFEDDDYEAELWFELSE